MHDKILVEELLARWYPIGSEAYRVLWEHSQTVAARALAIARAHPELGADLALVEAGAMLHDVGMFLTNAPQIHCYGVAPYIRHGYLGATLLRRQGMESLARIAERHTSSGLTHAEIIAARLPLPLDRSYMPETVEEKLICYADCFYSKTKLSQEKSHQQIIRSLEKHWQRTGLEGPAQTVARFEALRHLFRD